MIDKKAERLFGGLPRGKVAIEKILSESKQEVETSEEFKVIDKKKKKLKMFEKILLSDAKGR